MADTLDLGSSAERRAGSTPVIRTKSFEMKSQTQSAGYTRLTEIKISNPNQKRKEKIMKKINNYKSEKYNNSDIYEEVEQGIYLNKNEKIYVTSLSFVQETKYLEGIKAEELSEYSKKEIKETMTYCISQYPLEDILDKFSCYVSDFYEQLNSFKSKISYLEFASPNLQNIQNLRQIIGKHVFIKRNGDYSELIIK